MKHGAAFLMNMAVFLLVVAWASCAQQSSPEPNPENGGATEARKEASAENMTTDGGGVVAGEESVVVDGAPEKDADKNAAPGAGNLVELPGKVVAHSEMLPVPSGAFKMGRPYEWEEEWGPERTIERPVHEVYLDAYEIGKYPVTNQEYADALNWALAQGYLRDENGDAFKNGLIYAYGQPIADTEASTSWSQIAFKRGAFEVRVNTGYNNHEFSMSDHPVVTVNWFGAVAYCNWLSEIKGLEPCYNTADWTRYEPVRNGFRLPTEAEWERAAGWDGERHWRYGFTSDTLDITRANYCYETGKHANPLGLTNVPRTNPVGWYNGVNPARLSDPDLLTLDSRSPVGAYDMSGNVWEWCHDWWCRPFSEEPVSNPAGPQTGSYRTLRGCAWFYPGHLCRSAHRSTPKPPDRRSYNYGFRLARTP